MKLSLPKIQSPDLSKIYGYLVPGSSRSEYDHWDLQTRFVDVCGVRTALHVSRKAPSAPVLLFVHGIGGDHHGMVPLAYELRESCTIVLVDLPGHGESDMPATSSLGFLEKWARELPAACGAPVDMVIAHSFGCFPAQYMGVAKTCYVNPPLSLTPAVLSYSLKLYSVRHLASLVYNVRPYALWRGQQLVRDLTDTVKSRIAWVTDHSVISRTQFLFQARQARLTTDGRQLMRRELIERDGAMFILSSADKITGVSDAQQRRLRDFPVIELMDDHLSVLESPELIAAAILRRITAQKP